MSYFVFSPEEPKWGGDFATNSGLGGLLDWVDELPRNRYAEVRSFCETGRSERLRALESQLYAASQEKPPNSVTRPIVVDFLRMLRRRKTARTVRFSDGCGLDGLMDDDAEQLVRGFGNSGAVVIMLATLSLKALRDEVSIWSLGSYIAHSKVSKREMSRLDPTKMVSGVRFLISTFESGVRSTLTDQRINQALHKTVARELRGRSRKLSVKTRKQQLS